MQAKTYKLHGEPKHACCSIKTVVAATDKNSKTDLLTKTEVVEEKKLQSLKRVTEEHGRVFEHRMVRQRPDEH